MLGCRGRGGLSQVVLGRSHRSAGVNQVFAQGDTDVSQPGRGVREPFRRLVVLPLIGRPAPEFGLGDRFLGLRHLVVQAIELLAQHAECFVLGRARGGRIGVAQVLHGVSQVRICAAEVWRLKVCEQRVRRQARCGIGGSFVSVLADCPQGRFG